MLLFLWTSFIFSRLTLSSPSVPYDYFTPSPVLDKYVGKLSKKTGTTIVGIVCRDHVILGADTRSTNDRIVACKRVEKIHQITSNIYCCGAGTSADCDKLTKELRIFMTAFSRRLKSSIRSETYVTSLDDFQRKYCMTVAVQHILKSSLYKYRNILSAAFIVGGCDPSGPSLYSIEPNGASEKCTYTALGSGSLAALSILENEYNEHMTIEEGINLVAAAVEAGIENDLGSGSNVDVCIISDRETMYVQNFKHGSTENEMQPRFRSEPQNLAFKPTAFQSSSEQIKLLGRTYEKLNDEIELL